MRVVIKQRTADEVGMGDCGSDRGSSDLIVRHDRAPGVGLLAGWRGEVGETHGKGAPNPDQLQRYIENDGFWREEIPEHARYFKMANRGYLEWARKLGFVEIGRANV